MLKPIRYLIQTVVIGLASALLASVSVAAPIELTLLAHSNYKAAFDELITRYHALQSNVVVQPLYIAGDAKVQEKFVAMAAGGVPPDIIWHYNAAEFASKGLVKTLEAYIAKEANANRYVDDFIGDITQRYTYQGKLYALPFGVNTGYMALYNTEKFSEAGLSYPKDGWQWNEFLNTSRRLTKDTNSDGVPEQWGFDTPSDVFFPWVYSVGSEPFSREKQAWYADTSATVEALSHAVSLVREHRVTPFPMVGWPKFTEGLSAMYAEGNYVYGWMTTRGTLPFDIGVINWPVVRARRIYLGGYGLFIGESGRTQREEAAWHFINWAIKPEQQLAYTTISKQLPSTLSTIRHSGFRKWMSENPVVAAFMNEASTHGVPQLIPIGYGDCLNLTFKWAADALRGILSVHAAVDGLKQAIDAVYSNVAVPII